MNFGLSHSINDLSKEMGFLDAYKHRDRRQRQMIQKEVIKSGLVSGYMYIDEFTLGLGI